MTDGERELVLTHLVDAPRERVFEAWSDPAQIERWWGPHGMTTTVLDFEPRPGGRFRTEMRDAAGNAYASDGVLLEHSPDRIVFTDAFGPGWEPKPDPFMVAVIELTDEDGKTRYTATARHWTAEAKAQHEAMGFHKGWGESLDRLESLVRGD